MNTRRATAEPVHGRCRCRTRGDIEFSYFHIIACSPNSDGISIQSSNNIRIYNSYFRTWDAGVVLKNYSGGNTHDIR